MPALQHAIVSGKDGMKAFESRTAAFRHLCIMLMDLRNPVPYLEEKKPAIRPGVYGYERIIGSGRRCERMLYQSIKEAAKLSGRERQDLGYIRTDAQGGSG